MNEIRKCVLENEEIIENRISKYTDMDSDKHADMESDKEINGHGLGQGAGQANI